MKKKPIVSIALCTYNGDKYLSEQIDSILQQTYKNIELIVVDDCSNDNTIKIINNYQKNNKQIKLFQNNRNLGFVKNFEKAIELCTGEFIFLCDQDDIWKKEKIYFLLNNVLKESILIYSNALLIDSNRKNIKNKMLLEDETVATNKNNLYFIFNNSISGNTLMFRKELKQFILPFPKNINFHDVWIGFVASSIGNVQYTKKPLVLYRQHSSNVTNIIKTKTTKSLKEKLTKKNNHYKLKINLLKNYYNFLKENSINNKNIIVIKEMWIEYSKYEKYYFNMKLFILFLKNKDDIFISRKQKRLSFIVKNCLGIKTYKIFPFL